MSALGHKRTFAVQKGMSALPPKADMCGAKRDVRFVPIGCTKRKTATRRPLRNLKQRLESTGATAAFLYRFSRFGDRKLVQSMYPPNRTRKHPTISTENRAPVRV